MLSRLVNSAVQFANGDPGVATPFAEGAPWEQIAQSIDEFNNVVRDQAALSRTMLIDIMEVSRRAPIEPDLITDDGLHHSGVMYPE